jgi:hypothetical protein
MGTQGAVFNLVLRDERFDKLFQASDYLRMRLNKIRLERKSSGLPNIQPTFEDIRKTHILFIHALYKPFVSVASEYSKVLSSGDGSAALTESGGSVQFNFNIFGHFTSDMAFHVRFRPIGTATPTILEPNGDPAAASPRLRFCAYPGVRMFKKVEFRSNDVLIDDYLRDDVVAWAKHFVPLDQLTGWNRNTGQQELKEADYFSQQGYTGAFLYKDGLQTPKFLHGAFDMFVPLHFHFCRDASNALLNDLIPNTQRTITAELAPLSEIVQALDQTGAPTALPFSRMQVEISLYVNGLFVNPEIHDIFSSRIGFSLIRVHRRQITPLQLPADSILLDQLKFPAEFLMVGIRSKENALSFDHWFLYGRARARADTEKIMVPAMLWNTTLGVCELVCREATEVSTLDPLAESYSVTAHGTTMFMSSPTPFYNAYLPGRYFTSTELVSPFDSSAALIPFCLYPGNYAPSGYYNLSAGRELYLNYVASQISSDAPAELVISMAALNFLIRKGDSVTLKYAM